MLKPQDKAYIIIATKGFIKQLGCNGPIKSPVLMELRTAYDIMLAGHTVMEYNMTTKDMITLTLQNIYSKAKWAKAPANAPKAQVPKNPPPASDTGNTPDANPGDMTEEGDPEDKGSGVLVNGINPTQAAVEDDLKEIDEEKEDGEGEETGDGESEEVVEDDTEGDPDPEEPVENKPLDPTGEAPPEKKEKKPKKNK
jgi:hypothetical protein